ncbi:C-GCAxxG-C-C family protein [Anaerotruncus rubiinfantis]|uniref:C-GCAxxG-C-C family protein n=1 Tax=Anaerotruncus rubiinfantis TaxID=1720200 RepID=UPI00083330F0|nr:C-GCAxxG-C-C family protein [Anaerotruncus rubiinfantis]
MEKSRVGISAQKHRDGYNCCQAVVCTYSDLLGMDEITAFRASEGFGLGIAGMYETCGSVCAMVLLAGLKNSDANLEKPASKFSTFELGRKMADRFSEMNTTTLCKTLRGTDGKTDRLRSCRGCVIDCAKIVEDTLFPGRFEVYDGPNE